MNVRSNTLRLTILAFVGALGLLAAASTAPAQRDADRTRDAARPQQERDAVVVLVGGQRVRGVLVSDTPEEVIIRVGAIETKIKRAEIERVVIQRPIRERYAAMRAVIDDEDVDRLLQLVSWLRLNGLYSDARNELDHILEVEPSNGEAIRQSALLDQQIALRAKEQDRDLSTRQPTEKTSQDVNRPKPGDFPLLSDEQVNLIKVYEINLDDPPRLIINRKTVEQMFKTYAGDSLIPSTREGRAMFHRREPVEILETMFKLRARELYPEVHVLSLSDSLKSFRDEVNKTWLVNRCATTRCHGGEQAGKLFLYNRSPTAERSALTNLIILEKFSLGPDRPLIDYANPAHSPLLQMGLARHESVMPHPDVKGWRPVFRSVEDRRYQQAVEWIRSMHRPRPEYPIEYDPPQPSASGAKNKNTEPDQPRGDR